VVLNRDGLRHLDACFESLLTQELEGGFELVMVDNGSSDGSADHVRERFPQVRVIEAKENLGFAAGNNLALRRLGTPYAVLLNNDTRVRPGWLAALVAAAESEPRVGSVQAKLVFADQPTVVQSAGTLLLSDGSGGDRGSGEPDDGRYSRREEIFAACAAAALYRKEALDEVGLLDESFFMYYEDTDLGWRLRLAGWKTLLEPKAVVEHVHAATSAAGSPFVRFHAERNRLLMVLKNAPLGFVLHAFASLGRRAAAAAGGGDQPAKGHSRAAVLFSFLALAPRAVAHRIRIRVRRKVDDAEVLRWAYPRERWDARS
jgi:GT2 family glycosyltransferase